MIAERLTGITAEGYVNCAMQWGTDTEPQAREAYVMETLQDIDEVAFVPHPTISMAGCSPDGLVGGDGLVEIKCPSTATHIETLLSNGIPNKYITQMMFQMACTGRAWCDYVSFDPRMTPRLQLFIKRLERDQAMIDDLNREVGVFLDAVDKKIEALNRINIPKRKRDWSELSFSQQAGIRCNDPIFLAFLTELTGAAINTEEQAAQFVRQYCLVESRANLKDSEPAAMWEKLEREFEAWKIADKVGAEAVLP